jgi:hypothetical protein
MAAAGRVWQSWQTQTLLLLKAVKSTVVVAESRTIRDFFKSSRRPDF